MSMSLCVGIDIAKLKFDVAIQVGSKWRTRVFDNTAVGFAACLRWAQSLAGHVPLHVCMEAPGIYYEALAIYLVEHEIKVSVVNPFQIAQFAKATGERNKTDGPNRLLKYPLRKRKAMLGEFDFSDFLFAS